MESAQLVTQPKRTGTFREFEAASIILKIWRTMRKPRYPFAHGSQGHNVVDESERTDGPETNSEPLIWDDGVNRFVGPDRSRKWLVDDDGLAFNWRAPTSKRWIFHLGEQLAAETEVDLTIVSDADGGPLEALEAWDYEYLCVDGSSRIPLVLNSNGLGSELEHETLVGREKTLMPEVSELRDPWDATDKTVILPQIPESPWLYDDLLDIYALGYM
jgi:hypothetical protein